jgi:peptide/nickel transport system ATP-binding protein
MGTTTMKAILRILPHPPALSQGAILFKGDILRMKPDQMPRGPGSRWSSRIPPLSTRFTIGEQFRSSAAPRREPKPVAPPDTPEGFVPLQAWLWLTGSACRRLPDPIERYASVPARRLATNLKLLIADEPGTSLDVTIQDQVIRLLGELVTGTDFRHPDHPLVGRGA